MHRRRCSTSRAWAIPHRPLQAAQLTISGAVHRVEFTGTLMINPVDGATVRVCAAPGAPNCDTQGNQYGSTVTTANGGMYSIGPLATGSAPLDAYVEMIEAGSRTTFAYPDQPFTADFTAEILTFTPQLITGLALIPNGCTQRANAGMVGLAVLDCANQTIADTANLTLTIKQGGNDVQGTTVIDLGAANASAAGLFLICNVPPNNLTTIGGSWSGMPLRVARREDRRGHYLPDRTATRLPNVTMKHFALAALFSLVAVEAHAQPWAEGVTDSQRAEAQARLEEGNALFLKQSYKEALEEYQAALRAWDHPSIRFNIVRCLIQLDRSVDAYDNLREALRYGAAPLEENVYREALSYEKLLANEVAEVEIACTQQGVQVLLDGRDLLACPGRSTRRVTPGKHGVVANKAGFLTMTSELKVLGGSREALDITLLPVTRATKVVHRWSQWIRGSCSVAGSA